VLDVPGSVSGLSFHMVEGCGIAVRVLSPVEYPAGHGVIPGPVGRATLTPGCDTFTAGTPPTTRPYIARYAIPQVSHYSNPSHRTCPSAVQQDTLGMNRAHCEKLNFLAPPARSWGCGTGSGRTHVLIPITRAHSAVIGFDGVVRVLLHHLTGGGQQLLKHPVDRRPIGPHLRRAGGVL
jgi:hypothetical protein